MRFLIAIFLIASLTKFGLTQQTINLAKFYTKLNNNISLTRFDSSFLIISFDSNNYFKCLLNCSKISECSYAISMQNKCLICKKNLTLFLDSTPKEIISLIYQKQFVSTKGLKNYWTFNGNVNDSIGSAHLYDGVNAELTFDRFGFPNSALRLINGYYKIPPGVYISGTEFSILGWVKVRNFLAYSRLIDFGNGQGLDNIVFALSQSTSGAPFFLLQSDSYIIRDSSLTSLNLNQWQHIACVFSFPNYFIYIDGVETTIPGSKTTYASIYFSNVIRTSNFIGRSNWPGDLDTDADVDDLKLFDRALSKEEIQFEMNNNY